MKIMKKYLLLKVNLVSTYLEINFKIYACYSSFLMWWKNVQINDNLLREICRHFHFSSFARAEPQNQSFCGMQNLGVLC